MKISKKQLKLILDFAKDPKKFLIIVFLALFSYVLNYDPNSYINAKIIKVIDGDTIEVKTNDKEIIVRLFGIDAPEKDQSYGQMSQKFLNAIVLNKEVVLGVKDEDKYGRILAIVYLNDRDINQVMVANGYAWAYEHYSDLYVKDQQLAQNAKKGLWEEKDPIEPHKWRKQIRFNQE
ncbi:thermonuclease (SNc family) [Campylobacter volucris]|uniref:Thermonuclease (SNc family) n=1 Tax=Campylobacter volucris TaxID=1031542 RepID=A0AAE6CZV2_9BACT|nr:thermonuclease (SNc family) [Campylobacter volucris]AJC93828.1 endonuclease, thermonuclease family [Campylobacter volucris LMG 24379]KAB0579116.1 thermonuclease (SNc family) [Campylobacter volucris]QBL13795.1 thermonuclease (SNc family) [Campylobacter volucris]QEL08041.1 endonuclease, thermonuclease family [Campylobacter volucris]TXK68865.1 thermonuclease (SNc family) [Campylobacter volucris]